MWLLPESCSFCVAGVFHMLLKTWVLEQFSSYWVQPENCPMGISPPPRPGQSLFLSFFLSFLLILVVGAPQHEK